MHWHTHQRTGPQVNPAESFQLACPQSASYNSAHVALQTLYLQVKAVKKFKVQVE